MKQGAAGQSERALQVGFDGEEDGGGDHCINKNKTNSWVWDRHLTGFARCMWLCVFAANLPASQSSFKIYITCPLCPMCSLILWASVEYLALFVAVRYLCYLLRGSPHLRREISIDQNICLYMKVGAVHSLKIKQLLHRGEWDAWRGGPAGNVEG